jgi:hypothetical protein
MPRTQFIVMNQPGGMRWPSSFKKGILIEAGTIFLALGAVGAR